MELEDNDEIIENPTGDDIKAMVSSLGGTKNYYAILQKTEMTYIQTSNWENIGWMTLRIFIALTLSCPKFRMPCLAILFFLLPISEIHYQDD